MKQIRRLKEVCWDDLKNRVVYVSKVEPHHAPILKKSCLREAENDSGMTDIVE